MSTTGCPNPKCEYFNRRLPDNIKYCPLCSTPIGNVVPAKPSQPTSAEPQLNPPQPPPPTQKYQPPQPVQPNPNYQPPQPVQQPQPLNNQQDYQAPVNPPTSTQYQPRPQPQPAQPYNPPSQNIPTLKLIHTSGKEFHFTQEEGLIGRRSANEPNFTPDIDLSVIPHQSVISRRHARVYWDWSQNSYMIVDMSTNGIYLNNNLLNPGIPYRLINGTPVQLGQDALVNFTVIYA